MNFRITLLAGLLALSFGDLSYAYNANNIVVVGSNLDDEGDGKNIILSSPDGVKWSDRTPADQRYLGDVVLANNKYTVVEKCRRILQSPDGISWQPFQNDFCLDRIVWQHKKYFAFFNDPDITSVNIYNSTNGITFGHPFTGTDFSINGIARGAGKFVAVGYHAVNPDPKNFGLVLTSTNGNKWNELLHLNIPGQLYDVVWANNQFVSVGTVLLTSKNGTEWKNHKVNFNFRLFSIAWNLHILVAVGKNGMIITSLDGIHWKLQNSGTENDLNKVAWVHVGNQFVAVGNSGTILTSPNGISWQKQTSDTTLPLTGVAGPHQWREK